MNGIEVLPIVCRKRGVVELKPLPGIRNETGHLLQSKLYSSTNFTRNTNLNEENVRPLDGVLLIQGKKTLDFIL